MLGRKLSELHASSCPAIMGMRVPPPNFLEFSARWIGDKINCHLREQSTYRGAPIYFYFFPTFSPFSFFDNCLVSLRIGGESDLLSPGIDGKATVALLYYMLS